MLAASGRMDVGNVHRWAAHSLAQHCISHWPLCKEDVKRTAQSLGNGLSGAAKAAGRATCTGCGEHMVVKHLHSTWSDGGSWNNEGLPSKDEKYPGVYQSAR